jgi:hypothetical protein
MLLGGRVADVFGAHRTVLVGIAVFTTSSLVSGLAAGAPMPLGGALTVAARGGRPVRGVRRGRTGRRRPADGPPHADPPSRGRGRVPVADRHRAGWSRSSSWARSTEAGLASGVVNTFHEVGGDRRGRPVHRRRRGRRARRDRRFHGRVHVQRDRGRRARGRRPVPRTPRQLFPAARPVVLLPRPRGRFPRPAGESQGVDRSPGRRLSWRSAYWALPCASGRVRSCSPTGGGSAGWRASS